MSAICFVTNEIDPGTPGGIGRLIGSVSRRLYSAGWGLVFLLDVTSDAGATFRAYAGKEMPGTRVYVVDEVLNAARDFDDIPFWAFHYRAYWRAYRVAAALKAIARSTQLDLIECPEYQGLGYGIIKERRLWGEPLDKPAVWVRLHGSAELLLSSDLQDDLTPADAQMFSMERYCLEHADGWICPSIDVAEWYAEYYNLPDRPIVVSAPDYVRYGEGNVHTLNRQAPQRVMFFGKLQHIKGPDIFVDAALKISRSLMAPIDFDIIGHDTPHPLEASSYREYLEKKIPPELRDRFHFHGRIDPQTLAVRAAATTVAVVPSRVETFCLAAHELNWIGVPLILSDIPAFKSTFSHGQDCLKFDGSADDLARALTTALCQPELLETLSWNAEEVARLQVTPDAYARALAASPATSPEDLEREPLVSVVMPYYNMQAYVDETLQSVLASRYSNLEIIIVNDGSPDSSARAKLRALQIEHAEDRRISFLDKANGGLGSARNAGIRVAKGKYVLPLDSDDVITPDYIRLGVAALERATDLAAVTCYTTIFLDGLSPETINDYVIPYDLNATLICIENRAGVACSIFRSDVLAGHPYDESLTSYEDWDLWWTLAENGFKAEVMPIPMYRYRRRPDSMVNTTGAQRHRKLIGYLARKHARSFAQRDGASSRVLSSITQELRAQLGASPSSGGVPADALHRLIKETVELRRSNTFRLGNALKSLAAPFVRLYHVRKGHPDTAMRRLVVRVTSSNQAAARGHEAWIMGTRSNGSLVYSLAGIRLTESWETRTINHPMLIEAAVSTTPGAELILEVAGSRPVLAALCHPWSGRLLTELNGVKAEIDLYAPDETAGYYAFRWTGSQWRRETLFSEDSEP